MPIYGLKDLKSESTYSPSRLDKGLCNVIDKLKITFSVTVRLSDEVDSLGIGENGNTKFLFYNPKVFERVPHMLSVTKEWYRQYQNHLIDDDELQGSIAHEMGHLNAYSEQKIVNLTLIYTIAFCALLILSVFFLKILILPAIVTAIYYPFHSKLLRMRALHNEEFAADRYASQIPQYKKGLLSIFQRHAEFINLLKKSQKTNPLDLDQADKKDLLIDSLVSIKIYQFWKFFSFLKMNLELLSHPSYESRIDKLWSYSKGRRIGLS